MRSRVLLAIVVSALLVATALVWALTRPRSTAGVDPSVALHDSGLLLRDTGTDQLALLRPDGVRAQTALRCARFAAANGVGVCLRDDAAAPGSFQVTILDDALNVIRSIPLNGIPTRARVSASGRMVAFTVFVTGDSYNGGQFSTRTAILDLRTGDIVATLEDFAVDGKKAPADANFWGVSFAADDSTFYATMSTAGHYYLVRGNMVQRNVSVLADGVECPSLSPDGTRLAFKKRLPDQTWRLSVIRLADLSRTELAETRNVDDQAVWLDDRTVGYAVVQADRQIGIFSVPADGSGKPALLAENAESPAPAG